MADYWNNKSSGGCKSTTTELTSSAFPTTHPNEPCTGNEIEWRWPRAFLKRQERDEGSGLTRRTGSLLSQAIAKRHPGGSLLLPSIPEESETAGESIAIGKDGEDGQGNKRKNIVTLVNGDGNGSFVTVNEELLKDLQTRFLCDNEQIDTGLELNQQNNRSPANDNNKDFRKRRKILVNRLSSKKCRMKRIQLLAEKEELVKNLESQIEYMKIEIKIYERNQMILKTQNSLFRVKIAALKEQSQLRAVEVELKQDEIKKLKVQVGCVDQQQVTWEQMQQLPVIDNMAAPMDYLLYQQPTTATMDYTAQSDGPLMPITTAEGACSSRGWQ